MVTATRSVMAEMKMPSERKSSLWCIPRSQQSVLVAFRVLFGVGPGARSASKSDPSPPIATHCIDELIVCPTRVTVGSRWGVKSQADSQVPPASPIAWPQLYGRPLFVELLPKQS
jgi:hypothetical protein